jgi:hypothetical protein
MAAKIDKNKVLDIVECLFRKSPSGIFQEIWAGLRVGGQMIRLLTRKSP